MFVRFQKIFRGVTEILLKMILIQGLHLWCNG